MLILSEQHLIHVIRKIIVEGGEEPVDLDLTGEEEPVDLDLTGEEEPVDLDLTGEEEPVESYNQKVRVKNTHKVSEFLLDTLNRNSAEFFNIFKEYVSYLTKYERGNILDSSTKLFKILKSDDFKTQLGYSKTDNYKDLCNMMLKNKNWTLFVNWFLTKSKNKRTLTLDTIKIPNKNKKEITSFP